MITLQAADENQPDPPAALTYIITSLPIYGDLNDPCSGWIDSAPYTLAGYGNEVEYIPDTGYEGQDNFTFKANDGGVPPGGGDSNEAIVSINVTVCIFFDDFPSTTLNINNWPDASGTPTVDGLAVNEPSAPYSLHLEATDSVTSRLVDLYGCWSAQLHYWWKRVGTESADDLYVDYWDGNEWQPLQVLLGGANTSWEPNSVELPDDALHSEFRLRFWADCDSSSDEWYIDDVCIQCRYCADPPVLHDEPNTTQGCCNTIYWEPVNDANEYYAECAEDANFNNINANSGWIMDTSCEFCGLTPGQTYWYHVKAWAPFLLKTWLQTTQVDFETDTLTDTRATADGDVVLAGGGSTIFQDDFEDGNYDGWIHGTSSCTREVIDDTAAAGTTYSFTQIGSSSHRQGVYYTLPSITPDRLIFHVRAGSTEASAYVLLDGASSSECAVFFFSGYGQLRVSQDTSYGTSRELLTWYKVEFVFHWLTKTFDFYVDDELVADSIPFRNSTTSYINTIHLYNFRNAQAWWDEIEFYTGSGGGYTPIGDIVSTPIDLPADGKWGVVDFNITTPVDTNLTVDVLDASDDSVILDDVNSGTDINSVTATPLKLRGNLSTTDANDTPVLHNWSVTYTDPAFVCESDWSNDVNSTQIQDINVALVIDDPCWMYQNLPDQNGCGLTADALINDDPMDNNSYSYEWEFILPTDVTLEPIIIGPNDTNSLTFAARGCDEPNGLSDSGQAFKVKVTVTGNEHHNTGTAQIEFGIALLGDVNNDTIVEIDDRAIVNLFWRTGSAGACSFRDCNVYCDGMVDVDDRSLVNLIMRGHLCQNSVSEPCPFRPPCP